MGVEKEQEQLSAYDYVIKGKEVPDKTLKATIKRISKLKKAIIISHKRSNVEATDDWSENFYPAGEISRGSEKSISDD